MNKKWIQIDQPGLVLLALIISTVCLPAHGKDWSLGFSETLEDRHYHVIDQNGKEVASDVVKRIKPVSLPPGTIVVIDRTSKGSPIAYVSSLTQPQIAYLKHLAGLSLNFMPYPDIYAKVPISVIPSLHVKELSLPNAYAVDDLALPVLLSQRQLTFLDLSNTRLSKSALAQLSTLKSLTHLSLNFCAVDDDLLRKFVSALPNLKEIDIGYTRCKSETIDQLKKTHPHLEIKGP